MKAEYFQRLPESVQQLVTDGLDAEVEASLARISEEKASATPDAVQIAFLEGDILQATKLSTHFTGRSAE